MRLGTMKVAVVGAAVGGASTALLLARAGAEVTLYDRIEHPAAVGAGIALQPNGLAVLAGLGLHDSLAERGSILGQLSIVDQDQRVLLTPTLPNEGTGLEHILMVRRSELHEVLHRAVLREPPITTRFGTTVLGASVDGRVAWTSTPESEPVGVDGYDLVVGADGLWSKVRDGYAALQDRANERGTELAAAARPRPRFGANVQRTGIRYARGLVDVPSPMQAEAWTSAGIFGAFPVGRGTYFYFSAGAADVARAIEEQDIEALRRAWERACPSSRGILSAVQRTTDLLIHEVVRVDCTTFFDRKVVLVGDAAHAMAPNLGQGANSALVDAAVLVDELRRGGDLNAALASYDRRRRPAVRWVQDAAGAGGALSEQTHPVVRFVRDRLLLPLATKGDQSTRMRKTLQESPARLREMAAS